MSYIADFTIRSPLMKEAAEAVPETTFEMVDLQLLDGEKPRYIFWANGRRFAELDLALESDRTVDSFACLTDEETRRLYRVNFTESGKEMMTYKDACKCDIVFLKVTATNRGTRVRAQIPTRDRLRAFCSSCREKGVPFELERLFRDESLGSGVDYGLTERQCEALVLAYQRGYFGTKRETTLEEIAAELDISRQAFADRLRRGQEHLIANTLIS